MPRDPTDDEMKRIRRLLNAAGSVAELERWITIARKRPKGEGGRPTLDRKSRLLAAAVQAALARREGVAPQEWLRDHYKQFQSEAERAEPGSFQKHFGKNPNRVAERVLKKLRKGDTLTKEDRRAVDFIVARTWLTKPKPRSRI